ncbi:hypothetical protein EBB59_09315, partial [Lysobacter pythonis]
MSWIHLEASDGRKIDLVYSDGRLSTATAHGKQWTYRYDTSGRLDLVTLPDQSTWTVSHQSDMRVAYEYWTESLGRGCGNQAPLAKKSYGLVIKHPSGVVGTFQFDHIRHYRSGVPRVNCVEETLQNGGVSDGVLLFTLTVPNYFDILSLTSKTLSGYGIPQSQHWGYSYSGQYHDLWSGIVPPCTSCTPSKITAITQPDGSEHLNTYGIVYGLNEGKLLKTQILSATNNVLETQTLTYVSDAEMATQPFPSSYGSIYGGDAYVGRNRPLRSITISRPGVNFNSHVNAYDQFARPISVRKWNSLGYDKTDTIEYHDDPTRWVLGQIKRQTTNGTETTRTDYDPATALPIRQYAYGKLQQSLTYHPDGTV